MSGRGPRGQRGGGRGNPTRGDGDGNLAPRGRGRGGGEPSQYRGRGGRGDGDGDGNLAPRGRGRGGGESSQYRGRGGRGDGRGGRGDRREPKLGDDEYTVTDGTTSTKIFSPRGENNISDAAVEAKENQIVKENKDLSLSTLSLADFQLPLRPGHGEKGTVIHLRTNYMKMTINAAQKLFKYTISLTAKYKEPRKEKVTKQGQKQEQKPVEPKPGSRKRRRALALLFQHPDFQRIGHGVATDYAQTIITSKELPLDEDGTKEYIIVYCEVEEQEPASNPVIYTFKLSYGGLIPTAELVRYLASSTTDPSDSTAMEDAIQALNIIVARTPNINPGVFQSGVNKFFHYPPDRESYVSLGDGLIAVRGYYSSVRTSTLRTLLNVNAQTSPFYPAINVLELMNLHGTRDWYALENFLRLLRVKTKYMKHKDGTEAVKVKTILSFSQQWINKIDNKGQVMKDKKGQNLMQRKMDVDPWNAEEVSFQCRECGNRTLTVAEYFKEKYNITLARPRAWLLDCGTKETPVWIPPELCEVMPGQAFRGHLSEHQTSKMHLVAARGPAENARRIVGGARKVIGVHGNNPILAAFGVGVDPKMIVIKGRCLQAPSLQLRQLLPGPSLDSASSIPISITPTAASWNLIGRQLAKPVPIKNWSILRLGGARFEKKYIDEFRQSLTACGLGKVDPLNPQGFQAPLPGSEDANDAEIEKIFRTMSRAKVEIVLVILPNKSKATFSRVKYWGDVRVGIHSVCVLAEKREKGATYYANVALKFNLKLGGVNQLLPEELGFLNEGRTMVVGIDVTHPAPKTMLGNPSIAAVVASIDSHYGQWPGSIRCQTSKQEMVSTLNEMMQERLMLWKQKNKRSPDKILIYRDGVSEGQYQQVLEHELAQIREACKEVYDSDPQPQITIVVVGKRHHTRFYPTDARQADYKGNPLPGTIVDRGITMDRGFDFFLQAHAAIQGTAKPSHYVVILDEMKLGAEELQKITHHLSYGYGRATKAVSICPPAYYADILAERGRCYLAKYVNHRWGPNKEFKWEEAPWARNVHEDLKDSMFYI